MRLLITFLLLAPCFSCVALRKINVGEGNALNLNSITLAADRKSDPSPFYSNNSTNFRRTLLAINYSAKNPVKVEPARKMSARSREKDRDDFLGDVKSNATKVQNESWDEWGTWSTCSVTCGSGRQVRWRHCSAEHCAKGLKKAQIKACRLKDCDKSILRWLGIKSAA